MNRWLGTLAVMVAMLGGGTGCSLIAGAANPKAAFAIQEPATMSVVVRRAEVAQATAREVDRLLGQTGVDEDSAWLDELAVDPKDGKSLLESAGSDPMYAETQQIKVVPAEAWVQVLGKICSSETGFENLFAATDPKIAEAYADVVAQNDAIAELKAKVVKEEAARDKEGASEGEKAKREEAITKLEEDIAKKEEAIGPKLDELLEALRTNGGKAPGPLKKKLEVAVKNLRVAVAEARTANAAATLRYPMAVPTLQDDLPTSAKRIFGDIVEEQTGSRPDLKNLKPEVKLDGTNVKLTMAGIPVDKLPNISPEKVIEQTVVRLTEYVEKVVTLAMITAENEEKLSLLDDVLEAWAAGLGVGDDGADLGAAEVQATGPKPDAKDLVKPRKIAASACGAPKAKKPAAETAAVDAEEEEDEEESDAPKAKSSKKGDAKASAAKPTAASKSASKTASAAPASSGPTKPAVWSGGNGGGAREPDVIEMVPADQKEKAKEKKKEEKAPEPDCPIAVMKDGVKTCL